MAELRVLNAKETPDLPTSHRADASVPIDSPVAGGLLVGVSQVEIRTEALTEALTPSHQLGSPSSASDVEAQCAPDTSKQKVSSEHDRTHQQQKQKQSAETGSAIPKLDVKFLVRVFSVHSNKLIFLQALPGQLV